MDGLTLALDASTYDGSVAVIGDRRVIAERTVAMRGRDEERLMPAVAAAMSEAHATPRDLSRIVCGGGPGSFTSLRIAASIAKGMATGLGIPLLSVSSLALAAVEAGPGRWLVTLDAMRGERFAAGFEVDGRALTALGGTQILAAGQVAAASSALGAVSREGRPHARAVAALLESPAVFAVDLDSWEPDYGRLAEAQVRWESAHGRPLTP